MHMGPYFSAARTPCQAGTGRGARQRNSPTGGAAYGIPRYTPSPFSSIPASSPDSTFTGSAAQSNPAAARTKNTRMMGLLTFL